jgi:cystathionine gamma-synthase
VGKVFHSIEDESGLYDHLLRTDGGHGCLMSFVLKDKAKTPRVYDAMEFCKGPSLGTNFTLVCPYTLLAHYDELDWAESCGVDRALLRVSVGLEPAEIIIERMKRALEA